MTDQQKPHPIQPLQMEDGVLRFKRNKIVEHMADKIGLNELTMMDFPAEDWEQLAQLIGYSHGGAPSYVSDRTRDAAMEVYERGITDDQARREHAESELTEIREALGDAVCRIYKIHPEDLG